VKPLSEIAIGELSRQTQCHIETIRYYERIGLLPQPFRTQARFRRYGTEDVVRLRFIRRARQLGFSLDEVRALLKLSGTDGDHTRAELRSLVAKHVGDIRARITDLQAIERMLSAAVSECECGQQLGCPIMDVLSVNGEANGLDPGMR
jgi:MerR family mercuric resistance operon transcriptional regulator